MRDTHRLGRSHSLILLALLVFGATAFGCSDDEEGSEVDGGGNRATGGSGTGAISFGATGQGANGSGADGSGTKTMLDTVIRDFKKYDPDDSDTNPDFENPPDDGPGPWQDRGIVEATIGPGRRPVYAGGTGTLTTHGREAFDQWFSDVEGTNIRFEVPLVFTESTEGVFTYDSKSVGMPMSDSESNRMFFPLDDLGFGDQGNPHNYHFTLEFHNTFVYEGGEVFRFTGDDDVWTFIDGQLVIDLGGIHGEEAMEVRLDELGLDPDPSVAHTLDFFYAERHVIASNLRIDTTIHFKDVTIY